MQKQLSGIGIGLRSCHYQDILQQWPDIAWLEILSDNYLVQGGPVLDNLLRICEHYPVAMHSVGMSLGSTDPINFDYLHKLRELAQLVKPAIISDHLCWVSQQQQYHHELLPLPYTEEAIQHVAGRIQTIQDFFGQQLVIENASSYLTYTDSQMSEWEFLAAIAEQADCFILLDINNIYVSSQNHGFDPYHYINALDSKRIAQFHLAGYEQQDNYLLDSHGAAVYPPVWQLYRYALQRFGDVPTLIEWDNNIPPLSVLLAEAAKAEDIYHETCRVTEESECSDR